MDIFFYHDACIINCLQCWRRMAKLYKSLALIIIISVSACVRKPAFLYRFSYHLHWYTLLIFKIKCSSILCGNGNFMKLQISLVMEFNIWIPFNKKSLDLHNSVMLYITKLHSTGLLYSMTPSLECFKILNSYRVIFNPYKSFMHSRPCCFFSSQSFPYPNSYNTDHTQHRYFSTSQSNTTL